MERNVNRKTKNDSKIGLGNEEKPDVSYMLLVEASPIYLCFLQTESCYVILTGVNLLCRTCCTRICRWTSKVSAPQQTHSGVCVNSEIFSLCSFVVVVMICLPSCFFGIRG